MTLELRTMRTLVRRPLGMVDAQDTDFSDSDIDLYLNRAYWAIMDLSPFREKERAGIIQTVAGQRNYQIPASTEFLAHIAIVDPKTGQHSPLDLITFDEYEFLYIDDTVTSAMQGPPQKYFREACYFRLWPTPDQIYNLWIRRKITLADLALDTDAPSFPQVWHEVLVYGAVYRAFFDLGDVTRGQTYFQLYEAEFRKIKPVEDKELMNSPRAGVEVMGRTYNQEDEPQFTNHRWWRCN